MIMKLPPLIPQEIYLLERYSSLAYYGQMRDHFAALVNAAEDALVAFMRKLPPPDYRSRPLNEQPDAVSAERIIPSIQWVFRGLNTGYIRISHGDWEVRAWSAMSQAHLRPSTEIFPTTGWTGRFETSSSPNGKSLVGQQQT